MIANLLARVAGFFKNAGVIFKRELAAYFNSPIAYIFIIVFIALNAGLFMTSFFLQGQADMRGLFGNLPLFLIFFIPIFVQISAFVYIGLWFLIQLISGTLALGSPEAAGGVAWWGHIGGFVAGIGLLPFFRRNAPASRRTYPDETYHYLGRE